MAEAKQRAAIRMTWDASSIEVESFDEALQHARKLGLHWFDIEEWQYANEQGSWVSLGGYAWDRAGRLVSIPASEGNE